MIQVQEIKGLRADGEIMQFWTELFKYLLNKTSGVSLETFRQQSCIVLFYIINLGKVFKSQIYRVYLLFEINAKYISSSAVNNQYFHECVARVYLLIFSSHYIYLVHVFTEKEK